MDSVASNPETNFQDQHFRILNIDSVYITCHWQKKDKIIQMYKKYINEVLSPKSYTSNLKFEFNVT